MGRSGGGGGGRGGARRRVGAWAPAPVVEYGFDIRLKFHKCAASFFDALVASAWVATWTRELRRCGMKSSILMAL